MWHRAYLNLQLGIFVLGVNVIEKDIVCARDDGGEEEGECGKVEVSLSAREEGGIMSIVIYAGFGRKYD